MIDFDIEKFVRKYMTERAESLLKADFEKFSDTMHARIDGKRMLIVGGAGTIGSNYVKAALRGFKPAAMYVVDIDENQLTELTRELRSGAEYCVPAEYVTEPIDLGSKLFDKFFKAYGPFDIVANFAARKHVRAERDLSALHSKISAPSVLLAFSRALPGQMLSPVPLSAAYSPLSCSSSPSALLTCSTPSAPSMAPLLRQICLTKTATPLTLTSA